MTLTIVILSTIVCCTLTIFIMLFQFNLIEKYGMKKCVEERSYDLIFVVSFRVINFYFMCVRVRTRL